MRTASAVGPSKHREPSLSTRQRSVSCFDGKQHVAHEEDGSAAGGDVAHFRDALALKSEIADGQDFIDDQHVWFEVGRHAEGQARVHTCRVPAHGRVDETVDFGEGDDLVKFAGDLGAPHAENGAIEINVFTACQLRMKAAPNFEKCADVTVHFGAAFGRFGDARQDLQQRALAGAVEADNAQQLALAQLERDIAQRPRSTARGCDRGAVDAPDCAACATAQPARR